eukprot:gb/GECH01001510.1/.p1 GENE.gb/GECH01001510.1/~~gb/GECH01001510.1/.p1  ORF type:complete len:742 (+),score=171.60 gb/GECH01001510.1/:1-2226(+)
MLNKLFIYTILVLYVITFSKFVFGTVSPSKISYDYKKDIQKFGTVEWSIASDILYMKVSAAAAEGWAGVGFNTVDKAMPDADIVMASTATGVNDYKATGFKLPNLRKSPIITTSNSVSRDQDIIEFEFSRPLTSPRQDVFNITNTEIHLLVALNDEATPQSPSQFSRHKFAQAVKVNLFPSFDYDYSVSFGDNDFQLSWTVDLNQSIIRLALESPHATESDHWLGFGLSPISGGMAEADIMLGWIEKDGNAIITDRWAEKEGLPKNDTILGGTDDVSLVSGEIVNGHVKLEIERKLDTGDPFDHVINTDPKNQSQVIWAVGNVKDGVPQYHNHRGKAQIAFVSPDISSSSSSEPSSSSSTTSSGSSSNSHSASFGGGDFHISWEMDLDRKAIQITMESPRADSKDHWIGFGLSPVSGGMSDADIFLGWIQENGSAIITDRWASTEQRPKNDTEIGGTDDVRLISGGLTDDGGYLRITFERDFDTGDQYDHIISTNPKNQTSVIWAFGKLNSDRQPQIHTDKGEGKVTFITGKASENNRDFYLQVSHACIMVFTWGILNVAGIFTKRYLRYILHNKARVFHAIVGISVVLLAFVGLGLIIPTVPSSQQFRKVHHWFGIITLALAFLQPFLGSLAYFKRAIRILPDERSIGKGTLDKRQDGEGRLIVPNQMHRAVGIAATFLSAITIYLGIDVAGWSSQLILYLVFSAFLAMVLIAAVSLEYYRFRKEKNRYSEYHQPLRKHY